MICIKYVALHYMGWDNVIGGSWQFICIYLFCCASTAKGRFHLRVLLCIHNQMQIPTAILCCIIYSQQQVSFARLFAVNPQPKVDSNCGDLLYVYSQMVVIIYEPIVVYPHFSVLDKRIQGNFHSSV